MIDGCSAIVVKYGNPYPQLSRVTIELRKKQAIPNMKIILEDS